MRSLKKNVSESKSIDQFTLDRFIIDSSRGMTNATLRTQCTLTTKEFKDFYAFADFVKDMAARVTTAVAIGGAGLSGADGLLKLPKQPQYHDPNAMDLSAMQLNDAKKETRQCFKCEKFGHLAVNCRVKRPAAAGGFQPRPNNRNNNRNAGGSGGGNRGGNRSGDAATEGKFSGICNYCNIRGHRRSECRKLKRARGESQGG